MKTAQKLSLIAATAVVLLSGCSNADELSNKPKKSTTTTTVESSTKSSSSTKKSGPNPTLPSTTTTTVDVTESQPAANPDQIPGCRELLPADKLPFNYPYQQQVQDQCKQVQYCGTHGIEEMGTTWFTDGTTGWSSYCQEKMRNEPQQTVPYNYTGPGGDPDPQPDPYIAEDPGVSDLQAEASQWRETATYTPLPTNTDSADGYGPGQELPPFCIRFPSNPQCME